MPVFAEPSVIHSLLGDLGVLGVFHFVRDKHVPTHGVAIDRAVGMRLTFRQPPPIDCCSDQFLFFLNSRLAGTAYETWARLSPDSAGLLPPNRFHFEIHEMSEPD